VVWAQHVGGAAVTCVGIRSEMYLGGGTLYAQHVGGAAVTSGDQVRAVFGRRDSLNSAVDTASSLAPLHLQTRTHTNTRI